ncbi:hypothetical protein [Streptomyces sp. HUAS TT7]|uniref:hypothetical protein n=1 Tax=Streptomyces sp. HUAS TT7 TaxID=3447507 RepID=UPI003F659C56
MPTAVLSSVALAVIAARGADHHRGDLGSPIGWYALPEARASRSQVPSTTS